MNLDELKIKYDKLQLKYGAKELDSIYNGGKSDNPDICFYESNWKKYSFFKNLGGNKISLDRNEKYMGSIL